MAPKHPEYQYLDLLQDILENGEDTQEFNSNITIRSVFGRIIRFDLSQGFPLLTTKKVFFKGVVYELLWFLQGDSNIKYLVDNDVHIWDEWAYKPYKKLAEKGDVPHLDQKDFIKNIKEDSTFASKWGELGPVYGRQWRKWKTSDGREIDQIQWVVDKLRKTPTRKHILVSAWNPEYIYEMALPGQSMALPPCHSFFQINVKDNKLSLQLFMRSNDMFLGAPFNIASYALLTYLFAHIAGLEVGEYIQTWGDAHLYGNHFEQAKEQINREPRPFPTIKINPAAKDFNTLKFEDFTLENYNPHPPIKGDVTVVGGF